MPGEAFQFVGSGCGEMPSIGVAGDGGVSGESEREGRERGTKAVVFAEPDQTEADGEHAGMHEDGDGVVRRFELRGVSIGGGGETCIDVAQHGGRAEGESRHSEKICWCLCWV